MQENSQAKRFFVSGVVQGVGYRFFAQRAANQLGLAGYARNLNDGRVEAYAIGPAEKLASFRAALEAGPQHSAVSGVTEEEAPVDARYRHGFVIEHDFMD